MSNRSFEMGASRLRVLALAAVLTLGAAAVASPPQYKLYDLGVVNSGDFSQGWGVSQDGTYATGRSLGNGRSNAFSYTTAGGLESLPNLANPTRNYGFGMSVNDSGDVAGYGSTTFYGSSRLPLLWHNGSVSQLGLPTGQTLGDANGINSSDVVVGSCGSGVTQYGVIYQNGTGSIISTTTANGSFFVTAFGVNNSGLVVGQGIDPNNAAVNVGICYDMTTGTAFSVGALPGMNGALAFGVSNGGYVTGSSMLNQGSGTPFVWSAQGGMTAIPFAPGTSAGSGKGVNSSGWVVGTDSGLYAVPFLYDGTNTYALSDLLAPGNGGWDLSTNTSSSAQSISDNGVIVGSGVLNGEVHGYMAVPVPEPTTLAAVGLGALALLRKRKKSA